MPIDLNTLPDDDPDAPALPDFNNLPPQGGGGTDPLQPGVYRFRLPKVSSMEALALHLDNLPTDKGPRLMAKFEDDVSLLCLTTGKPVRWQVNDMDLERGKKGSGQFVSDLTYLFHATGYTPEGNSRKHKATALFAACGGGGEAPGEFFMTGILTATCSVKRDIYKDVDGQSVEQKGIKGCGGKWTSDPYPNKNPKVPFVEKLPQDGDGKFVTRVTCKCGASVRAFNDWRQIKGVE